MERPRLLRMFRLSTSAGRSVVSARSIVCTRSTVSDVMPWPVRMIVTSSSRSRSAKATSPGSPYSVTRLPRTWISASKAPSMIPRNSSPGPSRLTMLMLFGTTTVWRVALAGRSPWWLVSVMDARAGGLSFGVVGSSMLREPRGPSQRVTWLHGEGARLGRGRRRAAVLVRRPAPPRGRPPDGPEPPRPGRRDPRLRRAAGLHQADAPGGRLGDAGRLRAARAVRGDAGALPVLSAARPELAKAGRPAPGRVVPATDEEVASPALATRPTGVRTLHSTDRSALV